MLFSLLQLQIQIAYGESSPTTMRWSCGSMAEHLFRNQKVPSSILGISSKENLAVGDVKCLHLRLWRSAAIRTLMGQWFDSV